MNKLCALLCVFSHELRPLAVYESAEGQAVPPGRGEVGHVHASVALSLLLTPGQQPAGSHLRLCVTVKSVRSCTAGALHVNTSDLWVSLEPCDLKYLNQKLPSLK